MRRLDNFDEEEEAVLYATCHRLFTYDPDKGHLYRKNKDGSPPLQIAGSFNGRNRVVKVEGKLMGQARVIVLMLTGQWPVNYKVKFVNGDSNDTRRANLRVSRIATRFKGETDAVHS